MNSHKNKTFFQDIQSSIQYFSGYLIDLFCPFFFKYQKLNTKGSDHFYCCWQDRIDITSLQSTLAWENMKKKIGCNDITYVKVL